LRLAPEALSAFDDAVVIHDIATHRSVVYTDYRRLEHTVLKKGQAIFTHSPDMMTSEWPLSKAEKSFLIQGEAFSEVVGTELFAMDAAVYHKQDGNYYVGYPNPDGGTTVYEKDGILNLGGEFVWGKGTELYTVDLYEDIEGKYLPRLPEGDSSHYVARSDGRVELVSSDEYGSHGKVVEDQRGRLANLSSS